MPEIGSMNNVREVARRIIHAGPHLPDDVAHDILALGQAAVPALLKILEDDDLAMSESPGNGWAPAHAARLLGELRAATSVEPMLRILAGTDPLTLLHDQIIQSLPEIGAPVVEPALHAYAADDSHDFRVSVASVLARADVRDERIFTVLLEILRTEPSHGAGDLARYGDERALPYLSRAFDDYRVVKGDSPFANQDLVELHAAIKDLGGTLTSAQEDKFREAMEPANRWRQQMQAALTSGASVQRRAGPGRNDPCWCGSTKKYKKCHLAADEARALADRARS